MQKTLQAGNAIALLATLIINYLANAGLRMGESIGSVSSKYENLFTPAGYAFSIWGLIYLGLLGFVVYQYKVLPVTSYKNTPGAWFMVSCMMNILWVLLWLYEWTALSVVVMILLLISLLKIEVRMHQHSTGMNFPVKLFSWWPFSIYAGWVSVALIANMAAWLTKSGWNGWGLGNEFWTLIMILIASALNIFLTWYRAMRVFTLPVIWALAAIAVANNEESHTVFYAAIVAAIVLLINFMVNLVISRRTIRGKANE